MASKKRNQKSLSTPSKNVLSIKSLAPSSETEIYFQCPCRGEKEECAHCNGTGNTIQRIGRRSLSAPSPLVVSHKPFFSKREKFFEIQINQKISYLEKKFFEENLTQPAIFIELLEKLIFNLEKFHSFPKLSQLNYVQINGLYGIKELFDGFDERSEDLLILQKAIELCINAYEKALVKNAARAPVLRSNIDYSVKNYQEEKPFKCIFCKALIYDQAQHNKLFHPNNQNLKNNNHFI